MAKTIDSGIPPRDKRAQETLQVAYQSLEQRVEERTRELSTLLEVSHNIASTLEMEPLLGLILDQLKVVVDYAGATIFALDDGILDQAQINAENYLARLLRNLGYPQVIFLEPESAN